MDLKTLSNEEVIWQGRPKFQPYFNSGLTGFFEEIPFFLFAWTVFFILSDFGKKIDWTMMYFIALTTLGIGLYKFIKKLLAYHKTEYFITNSRVVIKKGSLFENIISLQKNNITFVDMTVSKIEQKFNVGTIHIHLGEIKDRDGYKEKIFYKLESVKDADKLLKLF